MGTLQGAAYAGSLTGLQFAWYTQYQSGKFHFFNDWPGWMQMDKVGHAVTAYQASWNVYKVNKWAGTNEKKATYFSAGLSFSYQLAVEVMDGFSTGWGFSNYDLAFNTIGSATFLAQQLGWHEQRVKLKYSFWPSGLTNLPGDEGRRARNLFGEGLYEQWLKDYNGQTYWASMNIWSLTGKSDRIPKWLNLAVGYSVNNLLGAESNTWKFDDYPAPSSSLRIRERQFLLSLDIDLQQSKLPKGLIWLKPIFGVIKFPFPALEWNTSKGLVGHWMYF
ncbi:MAG: DUF2279 domain-containing protein [Flavobacteriales bacterium]